MLVLDFIEDKEEIKVRKTGFRKRKFSNREKELKRYSINVNGRNVVVLELTEGDLYNEDVLSLLKIYKGRVLAPIENQSNNLLLDYTFNPKEYYQRAILSSLIKQIKTINREWRTVNIEVEDFFLCNELYELVKITKRVNIKTSQNALTDKFTKLCYYEYGSVITFKDSLSEKYDVVLRLDEVDEKGKLMINAGGKECLLYSDGKYFESSTEYQKLYHFNIEHNIICSAFSDK